MNDNNMTMNDDSCAERPPKAHERHPEQVGTLTFGGMAIRADRDVRPLRRATLLIIIAFWTIYYVFTSILVHLQNLASENELYAPRALVTFGGFVISLGMVAVQARLSDRSLVMRAIVATIMAVVAPALSAIVNHFVFYSIFDFAKEGLPDSVELLRDYMMRLWVFSALSPIILALSYAGDIREREQRISALLQLAHSAQLRALRNQLSPHFLFNALNSIVALISAGRATEAETMTENLADFLRLTLALDPQQLITFEEELRLQNLYLAIEQVRFPGRLEVVIDVPDALSQALVPSLITQPLIENTIKYGVARSSLPVTLNISARRVGSKLEVVVADSGGNAERAPAKGAHLGLHNVAERMRMHYGEAGAFVAAPATAGGFRNCLTAPLRFAQ